LNGIRIEEAGADLAFQLIDLVQHRRGDFEAAARPNFLQPILFTGGVFSA
jgi:hypothetical protein